MLWVYRRPRVGRRAQGRVFLFQLITTSLEPATPIEVHRLEMLDNLLREQLDNSGRFIIVPIPPGMQQPISTGPEISNCN